MTAKRYPTSELSEILDRPSVGRPSDLPSEARQAVEAKLRSKAAQRLDQAPKRASSQTSKPAPATAKVKVSARKRLRVDVDVHNGLTLTYSSRADAEELAARLRDATRAGKGVITKAPGAGGATAAKLSRASGGAARKSCRRKPGQPHVKVQQVSDGWQVKMSRPSKTLPTKKVAVPFQSPDDAQRFARLISDGERSGSR